MDVSETIIAASIGAGATLITAVVQLLMSMRAQSKSDFRPKKDSTFRSLVAMAFLMIASALSGYLYAQYRNESSAQDLREMREELNAKLLALEVTAKQLAEKRNDVSPNAAVPSKPDLPNAVAAASPPKIIQATVYVPECVAACTEATVKPVPVCGVIPGDAQVEKIDLYVADAVDAPTASAATSNQQFERVEAGREINGAKFADTPVVSPGSDSSSLCVEFRQWSSKARFARIDLHMRASSEPSNAPRNSAVETSLSTIQNAAAMNR